MQRRWGTTLEGRHALITGGGTGIGAAARPSISMRAGAKVSLLGRRLEPLQAVAGTGSAAAAIQCDVTDPDSDRAGLRRSPRRQRPDRPAGRQCRDRRERALPQDDPRELGPDHRDQSDRRVRLRAGGDRRPARERQWPPGVRRLGRVPSRRSLCGALCRLEARAARPDAQPGRRICQDQPDRERGLPGLCRHADDRPVGRARVARSPAAARSDARGAITNMNASGRLVDPAGDRQRDR